MKFESAATINPIDRMQVVGQPLDRIDGPLKTSGTAPYAYERQEEVPDHLYGYPLGAAIAKGRIVSMDTTEAEAAPGVVAVIKATDVKDLGQGAHNTALLFGGPKVQHYHQAIAMVVAETFEEARAAANLIRVDYRVKPGRFDLDIERAAQKAKPAKPEVDLGDFEQAFAEAPVRLDETYRTPDQSHAMMEPHASIAAWEGEQLTLWTSNQMIAWGVADLAKTLGIRAENLRLVSPYIGGGFGGKLFLRADAVLAALGARAVGRPVKIALPRPFIANNTTHRPATIQRIRIGTDTGGRIQAIAHESWSGDLPGGEPEAATQQTQFLYAGANRLIGARMVELDLPEGNAMRAPGEAPGLMALEIAMDEVAEKLGMDPVDFRILNDTQVVPGTDTPFSQRQLVECLRRGAGTFGWSARNQAPGRLRDGPWRIGMGVAAAFRNNLSTESGARVRFSPDGLLTVETDMTDIGTGSYTIIAQTAAEMLGLGIDRVRVRLGDSRFPVSAGSGGQWGANCSTSGVYAACVKLREAVAQRLGINAEDAVFVDGEVRSGERRIPLAEALGAGEIVAEDKIEFGALAEAYQQSTFGAHFVEAAVHAATGEIRLRRMLAVCACGRILNPKTARSQVLGAMTMGIGAAMMEELAVDRNAGFFANHDLAGYEVPVHADIPEQEVIFLDETDPISSPMKAKGVGELGLCGVSAAIANAVHNATGIRIRDYPVTLEKLLDAGLSSPG